MAVISREEFLKQLKEAEERRASWAAEQSGLRVGFFGLADDGDEAVVRFMYTDPSEFEILTTHKTTIDGKFRRVNCLRTLRDPIDTCPMCKSGNKLEQKFFIRLIEYTPNENGTVVATPKIWERPTSYDRILTNLFTEYGPLNNSVFKVKRSGKKGDMKTDYSIMYCNPAIYNNSIYPVNSDAFKDYSVIGHAVIDKTFEELAAMVTDGQTETTDIAQSTAPRKVTY